jgi:hypothetical protein
MVGFRLSIDTLRGGARRSYLDGLRIFGEALREMIAELEGGGLAP